MAYYTEDTPAEEPGHTPQNRRPDELASAVLHSAPVEEDPPVAREDRVPSHVPSDNDHDVESASGGLEDWGKLIGHVPAATAIVDSLPHHAQVILITGRTYRLKGRAGQEGQRHSPGKKPASEGPAKQKSPCQNPQE